MIVDIIAALTDSVQPDGYIKDMRRRGPELAKGWRRRNPKTIHYIIDRDRGPTMYRLLLHLSFGG